MATNIVLQYFVVISILMTVRSEQDPNFYRSDYKFNANVGGWLKLQRFPSSWAEADRECFLEGAVLASPLNDKMLSAMMDLMADIPQCGVYTGIHATIAKGHYFSVEGVPLAKIPIRWAPNEPDNFQDNERCLILITNGTAADVNCDALYPYICYKKRTPDMPINICGKIGVGTYWYDIYKYYERTGSCYKFHRFPKTWPNAFQACAAEGGYLTVINSDTEVEVIKQVFSETPEKSIMGNVSKNLTLVGFHDWGNHGERRTVHGKKPVATGYGKFAASQPDLAFNGEYCGAIFKNGLLHNVPCNERYTFICEITP